MLDELMKWGTGIHQCPQVVARHGQVGTKERRRDMQCGGPIISAV
jgi:hypothetical protein